MQYLVDSDWAIDYLNGIRRTVERIAPLLSEGIGISIISLAEIYEGFYGSTNRDALEVLYLDEEICRIFAQERRRLRSIGSLFGDFDLLIGATAIHHNLTVLTNNRRHFGRIEGISIISN